MHCALTAFFFLAKYGPLASAGSAPLSTLFFSRGGFDFRGYQNSQDKKQLLLMNTPPALPPKASGLEPVTARAEPAPIMATSLREEKIPVPEILNYLPTQELESLAGNVELLKSYLHGMDSIQSLQDSQNLQLDNCRKALESLATQFSQLEEEKLQVNSEIQHFNSHEFSQWQKVEQQMYQKLSRFSKDSIRDQLRVEVKSLEKSSDAMAEEFIHDGGDLNAFIKSYKESRREYHLKKQFLAGLK